LDKVTATFERPLVPEAAKYLAIPFPAALDSRGLALKPSPRAWSSTFVAQSKAGNLLIFQRHARASEHPSTLYILKTSVYVPPRLGLGDTIRTGMGLFTDRAMSGMLKAMKNAP
jgi:hypothetical protein